MVKEISEFKIDRKKYEANYDSIFSGCDKGSKDKTVVTLVFKVDTSMCDMDCIYARSIGNTMDYLVEGLLDSAAGKSIEISDIAFTVMER